MSAYSKPIKNQFNYLNKKSKIKLKKFGEIKVVNNKSEAIKKDDRYRALNQFQMSGFGLAVQSVSESSPILKLLPFFVVSCFFLFLIKVYILLSIVIVFCLLFLCLLIVFKPERTWSEPTIIALNRHSLGDKQNKEIIDIQDGEIVQPVATTKSISAKANIKNEISKKAK